MLSRISSSGSSISKRSRQDAVEEYDEGCPRQEACFLQLFQVEKASGGYKPVIDLLLFSSFMTFFKFMGRTIVSILAYIR